MRNYSEKIIRRKEFDEILLSSSIKELSKVVESKENRSYEACKDEVLREMGYILYNFGIDMVDVPQDINNDDEKVLYIISLTNVARRRITLKDKWWTEGAMPLLCSKADGSLVALIPTLNGGYSFFDKDTGRECRLTKELAKDYEDKAFCFYKAFESKSITKVEFIMSLLKAFTLGDIIYLLIISLIVGLLGLVLPFLNQIIFNMIIPSAKVSDIWGVASLLFGVTIVSTLFSVVRGAWVLRIGNKIDLYAQNAVWARIFSLPIEFFKAYEVGELMQRTAAVNKICSILCSSFIPTLLGSMFSFIYFFQIWQFSENLLVPSLVIILILLGATYLNYYFELKDKKEYNQTKNRLSSLVLQLINGVTKIKEAGAEVKAFSIWSKVYSELMFAPKLYIQIFSAINKFIVFGGIILLYIIAYISEISSASFIAFNVAFGTFSTVILELSSITSQLAELKISLHLLEPLLEAKPENTGNKKLVRGLAGRIEINNLSFRYKNDMPLIIDNLSFIIEKGDYIGIVGSSGGGKSTLLRLLLGFEIPEKGTIYYDNQDISGLDIRTLRQCIGVVLQNGKFFYGDIYSNIVLCAPWLSVEDAWRVAESVGLAEDIKEMPMGMFTIIMEEGGGLSEGQKQKLLIARALAANPDIIMFDEATSSLDNITQSVVIKTLEQIYVTRIVIAHRLSTIKNCSKIICLDKGQIAEVGTYNELMEKGGLFAELAKRQLS